MLAEKLNLTTYRLALSTKLEHVHSVFYVEHPRKYVPDPKHVMATKPILATENLIYEECPMQMLDYRIKQNCNKYITLSKALS